MLDFAGEKAPNWKMGQSFRKKKEKRISKLLREVGDGSFDSGGDGGLVGGKQWFWQRPHYKRW